jgi:hypothetical protein
VRHFHFIGNDEIIAHLAEHGMDPIDFEWVVNRPISKGVSRSTGLPIAWGYTQDGRYISAVYEHIDRVTILPVTAYEVSENG